MSYKNQIAASELIINEDGSIYHLHLLPEQLADTVITVGDPDRVALVSKYFDRIEHKVHKREFITHTGFIGKKRISVISTGIGTDNIDIVLNELDALVNIDLKNRTINEELKSLNIIRIGTSGCMRPEIPVDSFLVSNMGIGMDGMLNYYKRNLTEREKSFDQQIKAHFELNNLNIGVVPEVADADANLVKLFSQPGWFHGITVSATGFYAPQSRVLRAASSVPDLFHFFDDVNFDGLMVTNLEMETAAIYGLAKMLGHKAVSLNAILANRRIGAFSQNPGEIVQKLIEASLELIETDF
jgi:uridine phosphorylase